MALYCTGIAQIEHAETGVVYEINSTELIWSEDVDEDERAMGVEIHHNAVLEHPQLGDLSWYVAEYPVGAFNDKETDVSPHRLIRDFDYGFGDPPDHQAEAAEMVKWFFTRYEDPAHEMPYNGREGGYQYIAGGPYHAREELEDNFPDASEQALEQAIEEIERDGTYDWAPVRGEPDDDHYDITDLAAAFDEHMETLPHQAPGVMFQVTADGRIGVAPSDPASVDDGAEVATFIANARAAIVELLEGLAGSNAHAALIEPARRYERALVAESFSVDGLYSAGIRLENARMRLDADIADDVVPALPGATRAALATVLDLHGVIIPSTARGRALMDRAESYARSAAETAELKQQAQDLSAAIHSVEGMVDTEALAVLSDLAGEIGFGRHPERSTEQAVTACGNFLLTLVKASGIFIFTSFVSPGIAESVPGMIAVQEVTTLANMGATFFVEYRDVIRAFVATAGADLEWLNSIFRILDYARRRFGSGGC